MRDITIFALLYRGPHEVEGLRGERTNDGASKFPALVGNLLSAVREDETHSSAKILFACGEKDGGAKTAANENIQD
jgi:hypothetical protein